MSALRAATHACGTAYQNGGAVEKVDAPFGLLALQRFVHALFAIQSSQHQPFQTRCMDLSACRPHPSGCGQRNSTQRRVRASRDFQDMHLGVARGGYKVVDELGKDTRDSALVERKLESTCEVPAQPSHMLILPHTPAYHRCRDAGCFSRVHISRLVVSNPPFALLSPRHLIFHEREDSSAHGETRR
eukprot:2855051-Rhodomonas_salina.2